MPGPFMPGMGGPGMGMGMGGPGMGMGMGMPMGGPPMPFMPPGMGMQGIVSPLSKKESALFALLCDALSALLEASQFDKGQ